VDEPLAVVVERRHLCKELVDHLAALLDAEAAHFSGGASGLLARWMMLSKIDEVAPRDPVLPCTSTGDVELAADLTRSGLEASAASRVAAAVSSASRAMVEESLERVRVQTDRDRDEAMAVDVAWNDDAVTLRWGGQRLSLSDAHYRRLRSLYERHTASLPLLHSHNEAYSDHQNEDVGSKARHEALFHRRLFALVSRYEAVGAAGYQAALPSAVWPLLVDHLGISGELFASPLNASLDRFCSAYADTDSWFGSLGSAFALEDDMFLSQDMAFEVNPPFVEALMVRLVERLHRLLRSSSHALAFVLFVPLSADAASYRALSQSPYVQAPLLELPRLGHAYREGAQHRSAIHAAAHRLALHASALIVLQNEHAQRLWPWTTALADRIKQAFAAPATALLQETPMPTATLIDDNDYDDDDEEEETL